jgi:hypothetical protein
MADSEIHIVREDDPRCAELEAAGYTVVGLSWGAHLRLGEPPDLTSMTAAIVRAKARGLTCVELSDSHAQLIAQVDNASADDYPVTPATFHDPQTSESIAAAFGSGTRFWGGFIEGELVAITGVEPKGERWNTAFTSDLPAHRHLGFGTALKGTSIVARKVG